MMPFVSTTRVLAGFPLLYTAWHQEQVAPFRRCTRALVVRIPRGRALVFGMWRQRLGDENEMLAAIGFKFAAELDRENTDVTPSISAPFGRINPFKKNEHVA